MLLDLITWRRTRARRTLALALAASLLLPPVGLPTAALAQDAAPAAASVPFPVVPAAEGRIHTILLFPFANKVPDGSAAGFDATIVGARVENAIKLRLNIIGRYKANSFSPNLPQIERAVQDSGFAGLTEADTAPPFDTDGAQKGRRLADQLATDGYLLGNIDSVSVNPQTRTVSVGISADLYSTTTGRVVKAFAATGRGVSFNASDSPEALLQSAVNDAAGHIVAALNADQSQGRQLAVKDERPKHHSNLGTLALGVLIAAAVAIGLTTTHHHSNNNSSGTTATTGTTGTTGTTTTVTSSSPPPPPF